MEFLHENSELIDALVAMTETDGFKTLFGEMALSELFERYEATLADENVGWEHDIRERYEEYQRRKDEPGFVMEDDDNFTRSLSFPPDSTTLGATAF
jgi:hypothetical protein